MELGWITESTITEHTHNYIYLKSQYSTIYSYLISYLMALGGGGRGIMEWVCLSRGFAGDFALGLSCLALSTSLCGRRLDECYHSCWPLWCGNV